MKASRFTTEQIIGILQEHAAGAPVGDLLRRHSVSHTTFYPWRKKSGTMEMSEAKRLRALEDENARLKRLVAEQALNRQLLQDALGQGDDHP